MPDTLVTVGDPVVFSADSGDTAVDVGAEVTASASQFLIEVAIGAQVVLQASAVASLIIRIRWTSTDPVILWYIPPDGAFQGFSVYLQDAMANEWVLEYDTLSSEVHYQILSSIDGVGGIVSAQWTGFVGGITSDSIGFIPKDSGGDPIVPVDGDEITLVIGPVLP